MEMKIKRGGRSFMDGSSAVKPFITIITAAYNEVSNIETTIFSVMSQKNKSIEWIIIDGGSQDGSIQIYDKYSNVIDLWISEPDKGIYDAWNKGVKYANGEWIIFLGAGDYFYSVDTINVVITKLIELSSSIMIAYGGIYLIGDNYKKLVDGIIDFNTWDLGLPSLPPHTAVFSRIKLFKNQNPFDDSYKIAGDSKFMLINSSNKCSQYINIIVTCMIDGGISSDPKSWLTIKKEKIRIRKELKIIAPLWYLRIQDIKLYVKPIIYYLLQGYTNKMLTLLKRQSGLWL